MIRWAWGSFVLVAVTALGGCALARGALSTGGRDASADAFVGIDAPPVDGDLSDVGPPDDGGREAGPDTGGCVEGTSSCAGATLQRCVGGTVVDTDCALGCNMGQCRSLVPSNLTATLASFGGTATLAAAAGEFWVVDTDSGVIDVRAGAAPGTVVRTVRHAGIGNVDAIPLTNVVPPGGAGEVAVFAVAGFDVATGAVLSAVGSRPLVLLVQGDATVEGTVIVQALLGRPAAGSGVTNTGGPGMSVAGGDGGGAGGSFGSAGGSGGGGGAGSGGAPHAPLGTATLVPLLAGTAGGSGGNTSGGAGGLGGGAIQITAGGVIRIADHASIDASGLGGGGGSTNGTDGGGGGGGGSGGSVLLEARQVNVEGLVGVLGGGGGQGATCEVACPPNMFGQGGASGLAIRVPAAGSATTGPGGGGGAGCDANGTAAVGLPSQNGGGGGGGGGRIRINAIGMGAGLAGHVFPSLASGLTTVGAPTLTP